MILEKQIENIELNEGEVQDSYKTEIDFDSADFLKSMLSKFYSDSVGSTIREVVSNALDSHRAADVTDSIIVTFKQIKENYEFSVEDFGVGIDEETVNTILRKYGKSTKRQIVNQLGAYGLGWKAPLSYTSAFYFVGRKNGVETKWIMYEGEDDIKIDLLNKSLTSERNGAKVTVPVKWGDKGEFKNKIKEQLAYFEGVYFDCANVSNDFKIFRSEEFQWSELNQNSKLHLCLDNVYYPIDYNKLGISDIYIPVGLKFTLSDGIYPVPNRESIKYTKEAKEIILNKISKVADYLVTAYNEELVKTINIKAIMQFYSSSSVIVTIQENMWNLNDILKYSKIQRVTPKLEKVKLLDLKRVYEIKGYLFYEYIVKTSYNNKRFSHNNHTLSWYNIDSPIFIYSTNLSKLKKDYLRTILKNHAVFIKREKQLKLGDLKKYNTANYNNYSSLLNLFTFPKNTWRQRITELQYVISLFAQDFVDLENINIPSDWIESRKKVATQVIVTEKNKRLKGEISAKLARKLDKYSFKHCVFDTTVIKLENAYKNPYLTIYTNYENNDKIDKLCSVLPKDKVKLLTVNKRELKNLDKIESKNWIKMEDFENGKHKVFRRCVTAYLIQELMDKYIMVFSKRNNVMKNISLDLYNKMEELQKYREKYYTSGNFSLYTTMLELATEQKLFDEPIYTTYKQLKYVFERLPFLNPTHGNIGYSNMNSKTIDYIRDLFKYYKQKVDWKYYKLPITEEVVEKKEVTEELVNEII